MSENTQQYPTSNDAGGAGFPPPPPPGGPHGPGGPGGPGHGGPGGHGGGLIADAAKALGVDEQEVFAALQQGQSLEQVAQSKGVAKDDLVSRMKAARPQDRPAPGDIDQMLADMVTRTGLPQGGPGGPHGDHGPGGPGGFGGPGRPPQQQGGQTATPEAHGQSQQQ